MKRDEKIMLNMLRIRFRRLAREAGGHENLLTRMQNKTTQNYREHARAYNAAVRLGWFK